MSHDISVNIQDYVNPDKMDQKPIPRPDGGVSRSGTVMTRRSVYKRYEPPPKLGNPTPLGLSAFALSVMVISFYNCKAFGINIPNVAVGVSLFTGGVVQFAAGMWEFKVGNTFGGTGFGAFGGFWASFGVLYIPGFGIEAAYNNEDGQYNNALAVYCLAWTFFTFIFTLACIRTNMAVLSAFILLTGVFMSLTAFHFTGIDTFQAIAGVTGVITSLIVWYAFAGVLLTPDLSPVSLPLWDLSQKKKTK